MWAIAISEYANNGTWHNANHLRYHVQGPFQAQTRRFQKISFTHKIDPSTSSMTQKDRHRYVACVAHNSQATRGNMRQLAATCPLTGQIRTTVNDEESAGRRHSHGRRGRELPTRARRGDSCAKRERWKLESLFISKIIGAPFVALIVDVVGEYASSTRHHSHSTAMTRVAESVRAMPRAPSPPHFSPAGE